MMIEWIRILLYTDDTVLHATTRNNILRKCGILKDFSDEYEMMINLDKTKFFL